MFHILKYLLQPSSPFETYFSPVGNNGSSWHVAEAEISSAYKAFSTDKIMGKLGVYIGLAHANVTLEAMPIYYNTSMDINFNER